MKNKIKFWFETICIFIALGIDVSVYKILFDNNIKIGDSLDSLKMGLFGSLILLILIYLFYKKYKRRSSKVSNFLSILFTLFMIFGNSYAKCSNTSLVFGNGWLFIISILMAIGYYNLFKLCISYVFDYLDKFKLKNCTNKFMNYFKKHPFIVSLIIMLIAWLPYIIAYYPIILSPDPSYQIKQFFGIRTKYADYAILLDENVVLTNHHPVIHTLLIGGCLKLGTLISNDNLGLFLYSIIQILILSSTFAYTVKYIVKNMKLSNKVGILFLFLYSFVPMFPLYAMSGVKDVLFSAFIILYLIMLHKIIVNKVEKFKVWNYTLLIFLMLLIILFRNNGLYVIVFSFPFLMLAVKKYWKRYLIIFLITIGLSTCYSKIILPSFKITSGSIREMLSIPFQQTARYVKYHSNDLSKEEIDIIDKVLGYDNLAERYKPEISDPVKNNYNKYTTGDELKRYFQVWFNGFFKHPMTYIDATVENVYGYFYPEKTNWYVYYKYDSRITKDGFDYRYNSLEGLRNVLSSFAVSYPEIPIIGLVSNIGFSTWLLFILVGYVIYKKDYKKLVLYLPGLITLLVCIASPVNTYFRYAMPYIFSLPLLISFILYKEKL